MVFWQITILGVISFIFLVFAWRSGYKRGLFKEFVWAGVLIVAAYLLGFIFDLLVSAYNGISGLVISVLNQRGIAKIDPATSKWNPNARVVDSAGTAVANHGKDIGQLMIFVVIALVSYALVTGKPKAGAKPGDKGAKDWKGAAISALSVIFIISLIFSRLLNLTNNNVDIGLLDHAGVTLPSLTGASVPFGGVDIRVVDKPKDTPFKDWYRFVPILIAIFMFFYVMYVTFAKPATKTTTQLRIGQFFFLSVVVSVILIFAWQLNLAK
jgi:hypothetical protein